MPRMARALCDGFIYHVLNRGNNREPVFQTDQDYEDFLDLVQSAQEKFPVRVLAYSLMPNHFHFVLWPLAAADLSRGMHWLLSTHSHRYREKYESVGHVWQGRYKSLLVKDEAHLFTLMRYVEANPLRAGLCESCEEWRWSSAHERRLPRPAWQLLSPPPVALPLDWINYVNASAQEDEKKPVTGTGKLL